MAIQLTQLGKTAKRSAVLEERNRLAGEIHDSLAQNFAGICMQLTVAAEETRKSCNGVLGHIERARDLAKLGLSEARRSALCLGSRIIEESGLIQALKMLVQCSNIPGRLHCTFASNLDDDESLPVAIRQDLLRIAQEAISNAVRHAKPTAISISLYLDVPRLTLKCPWSARELADSGSPSIVRGFAGGPPGPGHAACGMTGVHEPDPIGLAVLALDFFKKVSERGFVGGIAAEHFTWLWTHRLKIEEEQ